MSSSQSSDANYKPQMQQLMQQVGISTYKELRQISGVSERQILRLCYGLVLQTRADILLKLAQALQISVDKLIQIFSSQSLDLEQQQESASVAQLKLEYQRLQEQMTNQKESLEQQFQLESLQALESWLVQWPTAASAAEKKPDLPAKKLLPLVKPLQQLLEKWGVEAIASVGEEVPYDPQWHQLMGGTAQLGDKVKVRYLGYRQGEKLLYRAKVSPVGK